MLSHRGNIVPRRQPIPCTREYQPACSLDARAVAFRRLDRLSSETAAPSGNVPAVNRRAALRPAAASPFHMRDDNDLTLIGTGGFYREVRIPNLCRGLPFGDA